MIGHMRQKRFFEQAMAASQLSHAYILSGPEGVGKKRFATGIGKALLCEEGNLFTDCSCSACRQVDSLTHPDFYMFDDKEDLKISGIRRIPEIVGSTAYSGKWKIIILDNAHNLCLAGVDAAANALLKTLEEPGDNTLFFLVTHRMDRLLSTIISRCLCVNFDALSDKELAEVCQKQGLDADSRMIRYAGGSVANIKSMADFDFQGLTDAIIRRDTDGIAIRILKISDKTMLQAVLSVLQAEFISMYKHSSHGDTMLFIQHLKRMQRELDYNVNVNVALLDLFVKLSDCLRLR